ncbi:MAG TPA: hypothetical protein VFG63_05445 [Nocardioidaceae bacterium]|nr:hypothetical protein [Nocardioidaceae bacterium]
MRTEWIPLSASALVTGVMALVLGALLNPLAGDANAAEALRVAQDDGARWLAMSVMYFLGSVALTLGMPTLLSMFTTRGRAVGLAGVAVFAIGIVGMAGFGMLLVFYKALLTHHAIPNPGAIDRVAQDNGLLGLLYFWIGGFVLGVLLIAIGLFRAHTTPVWVPILLLVFVAMMPIASKLGQAGSAVQLMTLAAAFTGVATTASSPEHRASLQRQLV